MASFLQFKTFFLLANVFFFSLTSGHVFNLHRQNSISNKSSLEKFLQKLANDNNRLRRLGVVAKPINPSVSGVESTVKSSSESDQFLMEAAIGRSGGVTNKFTWFIMDTGSNLCWIQCEPCHHCMKQNTTIFNPAKSSSFSSLSCNSSFCRTLPSMRCGNGNICFYAYPYSDGSFVKGKMGIDTIFFRNGTSFENMIFGCSTNTSGAQFSEAPAIMGFGRGSHSLISQLGDRFHQPKVFSYCLPNYTTNNTGKLLVGSSAISQSLCDGFIKVPLLLNYYNPTFYYLDCVGIMVGSITIGGMKNPIFKFQGKGSGGLSIDSGSYAMYLAEAVYDSVIKQFRKQSTLKFGYISKTGLDYCAPLSDIGKIPELKLYFSNKKTLVINSIYELPELKLACLFILPSSDPRNISVLGNYVQQNMMVRYDLRSGAGEATFCHQQFG